MMYVVCGLLFFFFFFFSSRRRHTRYIGDWSSDVCSSDLGGSPPLLGDRPSEGPVHPRRSGGDPPPSPRNAGGRQRRSEERRVGKECRSRWSADGYKKREKREREKGIEI